MNNSDFFDLVTIQENETESAEHYLKYRGINEHIEMAKYLSSFLERKPTYQEVATAFRYDKRLRRIILKYIGLLEEYFRAFLSNNYSTTSELPEECRKLFQNSKQKEKRKIVAIIENDGSTYSLLNLLLFSNLIDMIFKCPENIKMEIFDNKKCLKKNLDAINKLRNIVSHNRTLINCRDFNECTIKENVSGSSLYYNLLNLQYYLPSFLSNSFQTDIRNTKNSGEQKRDNQVEWNLIKNIYVNL